MSQRLIPHHQSQREQSERESVNSPFLTSCWVARRWGWRLTSRLLFHSPQLNTSDCVFSLTYFIILLWENKSSCMKIRTESDPLPVVYIISVSKCWMVINVHFVAVMKTADSSICFLNISFKKIKVCVHVLESTPEGAARNPINAAKWSHVSQCLSVLMSLKTLKRKKNWWCGERSEFTGPVDL